MEYNMVEVSDFLDQVINQDFASSAPMFKDIMGDIVNHSMEQEKVKIANQTLASIQMSVLAKINMRSKMMKTISMMPLKKLLIWTKKTTRNSFFPNILSYK